MLPFRGGVEVFQAIFVYFIDYIYEITQEQLDAKIFQNNPLFKEPKLCSILVQLGGVPP